MRARFAQGHNADGEPVPHWDLVSFAGAGGIRSSGNDMVRFLQANLDVIPSDLGPAMKLAVQTRADVDAANDISLCWHLDKIHQMPWHNGETGGFHSFITFNPKDRFGVFAVAGSQSPLIEQVASSLVLHLLWHKPMPPIKVPIEIRLAPEALQPLEGKYELTSQMSLTISVEGDRIYCQGTGQPRVRMYPESADSFFLKAANARLAFKRAAGDRAESLTLHQNGVDTTARRAP